MNRYSLAFVMMIAASFVAPSPQAGDQTYAGKTPEKSTAAHKSDSDSEELPFAGDPYKAVKAFLDMRTLPDGAEASDAHKPGVLFATVPHPTETNLAADFDEEVAALEQALQDSGYLFDNSWIPWEQARSYDRLTDALADQQGRDEEDKYPGILFFRREPDPEFDPYGSGLIVFLITEKPTQGLNVTQINRAADISRKNSLKIRMQPEGRIGIVGPNYTGSLGSLGPALSELHKDDVDASFLIRSGVLAGKKSRYTMERLASLPDLSGVSIDFASAHHDYGGWTKLAVTRLVEMGIEQKEIAFLSEDESSYGSLGTKPSASGPAKPQGNTAKSTQLAETNKDWYSEDSDPSWHVSFPRDISSLRTTYDEQGLFNSSMPGESWKRFLNLKSAADAEADSIRSFGGPSTVAAQESVLFGITAFLNSHDIHAIIISATNENDAYFLSQFFHINNNGVRIVIQGSTRLFLRGSTARFRGDLVVDDFPMLPRLNDWTSLPPDEKHKRVEHIFSTGFAQGIYVSVIDLIKNPEDPNGWFPEYATPDFRKSDGQSAPKLFPPMYLTAFGMDSPWPVDALDEEPYRFTAKSKSDGGKKLQDWQGNLPFTLFKHDGDAPTGAATGGDQPATPVGLSVGQFWKSIFLAVWLVAILYGISFRYAKPVTRQFCASFEPVRGGRYWCLTVILPAALLGCVFFFLDLPLVTLAAVSDDALRWHHYAVASAIVASLLVASVACWKAGYIPRQVKAGSKETAGKEEKAELRAPDPGVHLWKLASFLPAMTFGVICAVRGYFMTEGQYNLGVILNAYREIHLRSGLSLLPTWLLVWLALFLWVRQASLGSALLIDQPRLPQFFTDMRISTARGESICRDSRPVPFPKRKSAILRADIKWLWIVWVCSVAFITAVVFGQHSFRSITTLEPKAATRHLLCVMLAVCALMLLDIFQFFWVWDSLRSLLNAVDSWRFKRSFVPIDGFKWSGLWSFAGFSFSGQRAILTAQVDCAEELIKNWPSDRPEFKNEIQQKATALTELRVHYRSEKIAGIITSQYRKDLRAVHDNLAAIGDVLALLMERDELNNTYPTPRELPLLAESYRKALASRREGKNTQYSQEADEVTRLLPWQQTRERFLCLLYIGFIQAIIARLHRLMISVVALFSSVTVAIAIYPFAPMQPFLLGGVILLLALAVAFYSVFSQMDKNPILARIVNGDERKLEWAFYGKFAEAIALPVLTLVSSMLPGGTGRVLEVISKLISHGQ